jgi:A/G-specific adenine glycosylase
MDPTDRDLLGAPLLLWYSENRRDLPWRSTTDAYAIVVAEFMLQQTGVDRVIPRFQQFLRTFPTWIALATSEVADVIRAWHGLGYNRRAVNLHRLAGATVLRFGGTMPRDRRTLLSLPGIGPYTADAIASFVHAENVAAIDVNLSRVIGRFAFGDRAAPAPAIADIARRSLPMGHSADWNQALMDLATAHCRIRTPVCGACPLESGCAFQVRLRDGVLEPPRRAAESPEPFVGSRRYWRGKIVAALRTTDPGTGVDIESLGDRLACSVDTIRPLLGGLVRDGLLQVANDRGRAWVRLPASTVDGPPSAIER